MPAFAHWILVALYGAAAMVIAAVLPGISPAVTQGQAILIGLVTFALFALGHEWSARRAGERHTARLLLILKRAFDEQRQELEAARREIAILRGDGPRGDPPPRRRPAEPAPAGMTAYAEAFPPYGRTGVRGTEARQEPEPVEDRQDNRRTALADALRDTQGPPGSSAGPLMRERTRERGTSRPGPPPVRRMEEPEEVAPPIPSFLMQMREDGEEDDSPNPPGYMPASAADQASPPRLETAPRKLENPPADPAAAEVRVLHKLVEALYADGAPGRARGLEDLAQTGTTGGFRREPIFGQGRAVTAPKSGLRVVAGVEDQKLLDIVRDALRQDRVDLYLQPIVSLPQRKRRFYECYSRIRAEDGSIITPDRYLDLARLAGLSTAIDNMLLFRCVNLLRKLQKRDIATRFFCNISAFSLSDRAFFAEFVDYMKSHAELAPQLVLEIGQSDLARHFAQSAPDLERLKNMGYRLSIDRVEDFSALDIEHFSVLGIEFVKLPAQIILDKANAGQGNEFRRLKQRLDAAEVDLIVEKIESEQMLVELLEFSIDFGQGFLFGEPRISKDPEGRAT